MRILFYSAACSVAVMALSFSASAQINGTAYIGVPGAAGQFATLSEFNTAAGGANTGSYTWTAPTFNGVTFAAGGFFSGPYTGNQWVTSGGGTVTSGSSAASQQMAQGFANSFVPCGSFFNPTCKSTIMEITGTAALTHNDLIRITHDDGVQLYLGGTAAGNLVINDSDPTATDTSTYFYSGPATTESFTLIYDECCGGPADLSVRGLGVVATPEPASLGLMGIALLTAGVAYRRRRKAV